MDRVVIEVEGDDVDGVAPQIPGAETLAPGTRLVVLAGKSRGWLGKLLPRARSLRRSAAIGSALLARGYVERRRRGERRRRRMLRVAAASFEPVSPDLYLIDPELRLARSPPESESEPRRPLLDLLEAREQLVSTLEQPGLRVGDDVGLCGPFALDVANESTDLRSKLRGLAGRFTGADVGKGLRDDRDRRRLRRDIPARVAAERRVPAARADRRT